MARQWILPFGAFALTLAACDAPAPVDEGAAPAVADEGDRDRALVEDAIRDAYAAEGAEVTEIAMELSEDGSRYVGTATVRNPEDGTEINVDCRYTTDAGGTPRLNCDRITEEAG